MLVSSKIVHHKMGNYEYYEIYVTHRVKRFLLFGKLVDRTSRINFADHIVTEQQAQNLLDEYILYDLGISQKVEIKETKYV